MRTDTRYAGEMSKVRFWQEAALLAMQAHIRAHPPSPGLVGENLFDYCRRASRFAFEMAEQMHKAHGPSVAPDVR